MTDDIHPLVIPQLTGLSLEYDRPLIITDADEVLFNFMIGMEDFLDRNDLFFDWSSFALFGNIRQKSDKLPIQADHVKALLADFFEYHTEDLPVVENAAKCLMNLSERVQIIVLSNIPPEHAEARRKALRDNGMDFPLIANIGGKGRVVKYLTASMTAPTFFIDDIPSNHSSVGKHADHVHRVHYIADPRLSALLGKADDSHVRLNSWLEMQAYIEDKLVLNGF